MGLSVDGNNLTFDGTVTVVNGFNSDTGVAYLVLTPSGGFGSLPVLATGDSGLPPVFDSITVTEIDPADALPTPNPVVTMVSAGGAGVASHYTMQMYLHSGEKGDTGSIIIANAEDLAASPALGSGTDKFILVYDNATSTWIPTSQKVGNWYIPGSILATSYSTNATRLLASVTVPAQSFDWYPRVFAQCAVTGSSDTRVDLIARLNDPDSGAQVGYSKGIAGATPPPNVLIPAPPPGASVPGTYGKVSAGNAAIIYLRAEQKASSSNSWSTPASPDTTFCVEVAPVL